MWIASRVEIDRAENGFRLVLWYADAGITLVATSEDEMIALVREHVQWKTPIGAYPSSAPAAPPR